jgi:hypothetical protein
MKTIVFLQVGDDPNVELMVKSIKLLNPSAHIIQCSDLNTNKIYGVTEVFRLDSNFENLMTFRLEAFYKLKLTEPAIYMDTDMLVTDEIFTDQLLQDAEAALCHRSFGRNALINISFRNMDLSEYSNKTLSEVYPILACFTVTKSYKFWQDCYDNLLQLDKKFHWWYGDQEAMRNVVNSGKFTTRYLPESQVACLPEFLKTSSSPICLHFKGAQRKGLMLDYFNLILKNNGKPT